MTTTVALQPRRLAKTTSAVPRTNARFRVIDTVGTWPRSIQVTCRKEHRALDLDYRGDPRKHSLNGWFVTIRCQSCDQDHTVPAFSDEARKIVCACGYAEQLATIGRDGSVKVRCYRTKAHGKQPYYISFNVRDLLLAALSEQPNVPPRLIADLNLLGGY